MNSLANTTNVEFIVDPKVFFLIVDSSKLIYNTLVFRYIFSKLKQINSHIIIVWPSVAYASVIDWTRICPPPPKKKINKQTNENKEIIRFFYQIALFILFPSGSGVRILCSRRSEFR